MTNTELAILSLIVETPRHGYQIEQVIEQRGMREWTEIGFSSIYYILKKLEKNGWVQSQVETEGRGPARKVYHVTAEGLEAWQEATLQALSSPAGRHIPLMMGLSNLPGLPRQQAIAALRQYSARLIGQRDHIRIRRHQQASLPYFVDAMFDLSLTLIEAELQWVERFVDQLRELPASSEQGVNASELERQPEPRPSEPEGGAHAEAV
jgi:DNA-binding PadR family transcriptional regulator